MKAEELVALAAAHGIDLVQAAQLSAKPAVNAAARRRGADGRYYETLLPRTGLEALGSSSSSFERPTWTVAELGQAAAGVPPIPFMAACYSLAGDASVYWKLWEALWFVAARLRARNNWPIQVRGIDGAPAHFYLEKIAQLVLDEDAHPYYFSAAPQLYCVFLEVDERTWRRGLFERFEAVKLRYLGWIDQAARTMQPRLEELEEA